METRHDTPSRFLDLLQLADSALPTGGYAFSGGLEAAARLGFLRNGEDLRRYFLHYLEQFAWADLPYMNACWTVDADSGLRELIEELDALLSIPTANRASVIQGRGWLSILQVLYPGRCIDALAAWFAEHALPTHYLICVAAGLRRAGWECTAARALCYYVAARDQTSAAVRLGLLGPVEGQRLLTEGIAAGEINLAETAHLQPADARRCSPMMDIAQARHTGLYSRLFQS